MAKEKARLEKERLEKEAAAKKEQEAKAKVEILWIGSTHPSNTMDINFRQRLRD